MQPTAGLETSLRLLGDTKSSIQWRLRLVLHIRDCKCTEFEIKLDRGRG